MMYMSVILSTYFQLAHVVFGVLPPPGKPLAGPPAQAKPPSDPAPWAPRPRQVARWAGGKSHVARWKQ